MKVDVIYNTNCLTGIPEKLPNNSVDTIITSPPYRGLRDYGEDTKTIWGGNKDCKHQWVENSQGKKRGNWGIGGWDRPSRRVCSGNLPVKSSFCQKCGAWYGQLGLEPTLIMYIEHLLLITKELKRVLKPTGVMFWN